MVQALTMAIGKKGIDFLTSSLISGIAVKQLKNLTPPNHTLDINTFYVEHDTYSNFKIYLTNGRMDRFLPNYSGVTQKKDDSPSGCSFNLRLNAANFSATYDWRETYRHRHCVPNIATGGFLQCNDYDRDDSYNYKPDFSSMNVTITCQFEYVSSTNQYQIVVRKSSVTTTGESANLPAKSAIHSQESAGCFKRKVNDVTRKTISSIDFQTPIDNIINGILRTLPASTELGDKIRFDYVLADAGLAFPNADGITIGATGVASYDGTAYNGDNPPTLPIPAVPTDDDDHYMNIYVADWAINGLNWAYYSAGKLNLSLGPSDLPNPSALKAQTYAALKPAFKQYGNDALHANITPKAAPVTAFQAVYIFSSEAMSQLQAQLPPSVYQLLGGFSGNAYTSTASLETALQSTNIEQQYYGTIEKATEQKGMVTTQTMTFELQVVNGAPTLPNVIFDVERVDVLTDLAFGTTGSGAQSMQFDFINVSNSATFVSTTIPGFHKDAFGTIVWPVVGESNYAEAMTKLGKIGVAIPIARGFTFLFTDSVLSIQDSYVSISTQLEFKSEQLPHDVRQNVLKLVQRADPLTGKLETHIEAA